MNLILPEGYQARLSVRETEAAIKYIRDTFQKEFGAQTGIGAYFRTAFRGGRVRSQ